MNTRWLAAIFAACFAVVMIATLPMAVVLRAVDLPAHGVVFSRVSGTVWNGEIAGLAWRGHDLGGARLALRPLSLFIGRLGVDIDLDGAGLVDGGGFIALSPGGLHVRDLALSADVADLPILLPLSGRVALDLSRADVNAAGCRQIEGSVRTDALKNRPAGLDWSGPELKGPMTCSEGAIMIPMRGAAGSETIGVAMTLGKDGSFGVRVDARTPNAAVLSVLSAIGFVESDGVMTLTQRGRWI